jgi:hypothetical protein
MHERKSCGETFEDVDFEPGDGSFEAHGVREGQSQEHEDHEHRLAVAHITSCTETYLLLEAMDVEYVPVGLVGVPAVATDEPIEGRNEAVFTARIGEIEAL